MEIEKTSIFAFGDCCHNDITAFSARLLLAGSICARKEPCRRARARNPWQGAHWYQQARRLGEEGDAWSRDLANLRPARQWSQGARWWVCAHSACTATARFLPTGSGASRCTLPAPPPLPHTHSPPPGGEKPGKNRRTGKSGDLLTCFLTLLSMHRSAVPDQKSVHGVQEGGGLLGKMFEVMFDVMFVNKCPFSRPLFFKLARLIPNASRRSRIGGALAGLRPSGP